MILIYIVIGVVLLLTVGLYNRYLINSSLRDKALFHGEDITTIVLGDSHTQTSVQPNFVTNSVNISRHAENYFYTYYKLAHLLEMNPQVRRVVVGFSYHNLTKFTDTYIYDDAKNFNFLDSYYMLFDHEGKIDIASRATHYLVCLLKYDLGIPVKLYSNNLAIKQLMHSTLTNADFKFIGGYYASDKSNLAESFLADKITELFLSNGGGYVGTSDLMVTYLHKILDLCQARQVEVVLLNTPLLPEYKKRIPPEAISDFETEKNLLLARFPAVRYLDWSEYRLERHCFGDGDHLNASGAVIISSELERILNDGSQ